MALVRALPSALLPVRPRPLAYLAIAVALCLGCVEGRAQQRVRRMLLPPPYDDMLPAAVIADAGTNLPRDTTISSDAPALWEQHQGLILSALAVIAFEAALIAALLILFLRRRRAEHSLKESEERWRSVFETSAAGVAVMDANASFVATNAAFQSMVGYADEELRGLSLVDLSVADERESSRQLVDELRTARDGTAMRSGSSSTGTARRSGATSICRPSRAMTPSPGSSSRPRSISPLASSPRTTCGAPRPSSRRSPG